LSKIGVWMLSKRGNVYQRLRNHPINCLISLILTIHRTAQPVHIWHGSFLFSSSPQPEPRFRPCSPVRFQKSLTLSKPFQSIMALTSTTEGGGAYKTKKELTLVSWRARCRKTLQVLVAGARSPGAGFCFGGTSDGRNLFGLPDDDVFVVNEGAGYKPEEFVASGPGHCFRNTGGLPFHTKSARCGWQQS
jgi:hypothetical protein